MTMKKTISVISESEVTPYEIYQQRRDFIKTGIAMAAAAAFPSIAESKLALGKFVSSTYSTDEEKTPFKDVTTYNNFYEFGTAKK